MLFEIDIKIKSVDGHYIDFLYMRRSVEIEPNLPTSGASSREHLYWFDTRLETAKGLL